ncbi:MAG: hypothetical protein A2015_12515 [Spirochaetes bacterium GWF1_31_7]|nr:MAG: hypothetical protein A2Y30_12495 [Spirochaetes bacterium GWE1_32_154]OHD44811.1 MAG: hypothetical protein A2Y29_03375 [Spirochaetes bacterium GWE2_31_10]OHD49603.1 MAG: hypothetical protein A2015_12515 [Spirochaetes bacterium GWF1_31_7]HBD93758.1 hypothetical protein [Spirochaetia bacterium]
MVDKLFHYQPYKQLLKQNYPGTRKIVFVTLLFSAVTITGLLPVMLQRRIFDKAVPSGDIRYLFVLLAGVIVSNLIILVLSIVQDFFAGLISEGTLYNLRQWFTKSVLKMEQKKIDAKSSGEVNRIYDDCLAVNETLKSMYLDIIKNSVVITIYLPLMFILSWKLSLVRFLPFPVLYCISKKFAVVDRFLEKKVWNDNSAITTVFSEIINSFRIIKSYSAESRFFRRINAGFMRVKKNSIIRKTIQYVWGIISSQIQAINNSVIFFIAAFEIINGRFTIGSFIMFNAVSEISIGSLSAILNIQRLLLQTLNPLARYNEIVTDYSNVHEVKHCESIARVPGNIRLDGVRFSYNDRVILQNVYLEINQGERIAVVGRSGSGKSTLANILLSFYKPDSGTVKLNGVDYHDIPNRVLRKNIGIVPQDNTFFSGTIRENLLPGYLNVTDEEIYEALKQANALEFVYKLPGKLLTEYGSKGINLSGGQKQRLALARIFLLNPSVIILDEATSALDPENERNIQSVIEKIDRKFTVISITHKLSNVIKSDRIIVMENGCIVEDGNHDQLVDYRGNYYGLYKNMELR